MAVHEYKLEIQRPSVNATLYYNTDGTLDLTDPDSGKSMEYLQTKLTIARDLFNWMKMHGVTSWECTKV